MKLRPLTVYFAAVLLLCVGVTGWADVSKQAQEDLTKLLLGKQVKPLLDLPATKEGINVYVGPEHKGRVDERGVDMEELTKYLKSKGVGVQTGAAETITDVRVDNDRVEVHIGGGGEGRRGSKHANKVSPSMLRAGGWRVNFRYGRALSDNDMQPAKILPVIARVLDVSEIQQEQSEQQMPEEFKSAIKSKTVQEGMTYQMVLMALGDPDQKKIGDSSTDLLETWFYLKEGHRWVVDFTNGKVSKFAYIDRRLVCREHSILALNATAMFVATQFGTFESQMSKPAFNHSRLAVLVVSLSAIVLVATAGAHGPALTPPKVTILRTPDGGIQPQAVVDRTGVLHLIYLKGNPASADIYYVQRAPGDADFSKPIRVNRAGGEAIGIGTVRGPQLAIGRNGLVHVAWMGAHAEGPQHIIPMLYTRLNDAGSAFEPERNVMQFASGLDGGASVAADNFGNVYVVWHANPESNGEAHRRVWMARSSDDGRTFSREVAVDPQIGNEPIGACGCCGMRALTDSQGTLYVFYRAATEGIHRDMTLLVSHDHGDHFTADRVAKWEINACPMSTDFISESTSGTRIAWETAGQVFYAGIAPNGIVSEAVAAPSPAGGRKHPVAIANAKGETLLAWTDGTGWERGGSVMWQLYGQAGRPLDVKGSAPGLPVWDLVAAYQEGSGFTLIY